MAVSREALEVEVSVRVKDGGRDVKNLGKEVENLTVELKDANKAGGGFSDTMGKLGASVVVVNQAMDLARRAMSALGAAFDATAGRASRLETAVAEIKTLLDEAQLSTVDFAAEVNKLRTQFGGGVEDKAKAFYQAISSGAVDAKGSIELLNVANRLAIGGVTNLQTSVDGLTNILNAYGLTADTATRVSDVLFIGMKAGKTTIGELARELGDVLTVASAMQVPFEELVGAVSATTTAGLRTNLAVTSLRAAIVALSRPTEAMSRQLKELGITSIQTAIQQRGLVQVIRQIVKASGGSAEAITELFGAIESLPAVTALAGESVGAKFDEIQRQIEVASRNIGATTTEAFDKIAETAEFRFGIASAKIDVAMTKIGASVLEKAVPAIENLTSSILSGASAITRAMQSVQAFFDAIQWDKVFLALIPVVATLAAVFSTQLVAAVSAFAVVIATKAVPAIIAMTAAAAPLLLKVVAIASVFVLAEKVGQGLLIVWDAMKSALFGLVEGFADVANKIPGLKGKFDDLKASMREAGRAASDDLTVSVNIFASKAGVINDVITELKNGIDAFGASQDAAALQTDGLNKVMTETVKVGKAAAASMPSFDMKLDEQTVKNAVREYERLSDSIAKFGATENLRIKATQAARLAEIASVESQLRAAKQLTAERQKTLTMARQIAESESTSQQIALTKQLMGEVDRVNKAAIAGLQTQEDLIYQRLETQLSEIDTLRERLRLEGRLTGELDAQLAAAKAAAKGGAQKEVSESRTKDFSQLTGIDVKLADSFSPDLMAAVTSAVQPIMAVMQIAEGVVSSINNIASTLEGIVSLPERLFEAILRLDDAVVSLIRDFLPNLISNLGNIIGELIEAILFDIPNALLELSDRLPEMLVALIERLPEFITRAVEGLMTMGPRLGVAIINGIIVGIPRIIVALVKAIPEIAVAFVEGIMAAIGDIGDMFGRLLSGKGFSGMVSRGLEDAADSFAGAITGVGEELFSVLDARGEASGVDLANRIASAIESATSRAIGWLKAFWEGLWKFVSSAFQWVVDNVLAPMGQFVLNAFQWVVDNVLAPMAGVVVSAFQWVVDNVLLTLAGVVSSSFQWVVDNVLAPMANVVAVAFQWVVDNVLLTLAGVVSSSFQWVVDNILAPMTNVVMNAFSWVVTNVLEPMAGFVATAFQWVIENVLFKLPEYVALALVEVFTFLTTTLPTLLGDAIRGTWSLLEAGGSMIWAGFKTAITASAAFIGDLGVAIWNGFKAVATVVATGIYSLGKTIWAGLYYAASNAVTGMKVIGKGFWSGLKSGITGAVSVFKSAGTWIVQGIMAGIGAVVNAIKDAVAGALGVGGSGGPRSIGEAFDPTSSRSVVSQVGRALDPTSWFARGGLVQYAQNGALMQPRGTDVVPAMLTPGEFVISRDAVRSLGLSNLQELNRGRMPGSGGDVTVNLDITTSQPIDESFIRQRLMPTIKDELRRQSLDGRRILSTAGVRS